MAKLELSFWRRQPGTQASAGFSALAHVLVIGAWAIVTLPSVSEIPAQAESRPWYMPPPNPKPVRPGSAETLRYVELAPEGIGAGLGAEGAGFARDVGPADGGTAGNIGRDSTTTPERQGSDSGDSVFTIIEVDSAATRLPGSAAPQYPLDLLNRRIEGQAIVQFVVDTTGFADSSSFSVVLASHTGFAKSIRDALPGMRFSTARIGSIKVRQLVELPFSFNIAELAPLEASAATATATSTKKKPE